MEEQRGRRRRLVLVPYPMQGHITPMLQLGTILHSRGFSITIALSQFDFPNTSNHPDFVFLPLSNDSLYRFNDPGDIVTLISNRNLSYRVSLQELLIEMIEKQDRLEELPCIIFDPLMYSAEAVALHLKLPSIIFRTACATFALSFYVCPKIQKEGYTPFRASKSLELVPEFHPLRFKDLPVFKIKNVDEFLQYVTTITNLRTSGMIWNSIDCLEQSSLVQLRPKLQVAKKTSQRKKDGRAKRHKKATFSYKFSMEGHINPMLQLATILHSRGFSITLVHPKFNSPNPYNHPEFTFIPISDNSSESKVSTGDILSNLSALNKNCEAPFKQCIEQLLKEDDHHDRIPCIVYDGLMFFSQSVADHFKLPGICPYNPCCHNSSLCCLSASP
ncbi:hypothetical protein QYF36_014084 [Acer negundo]|nr:hypothetical protein QYF36_014084 [Acer negundo]